MAAIFLYANTNKKRRANFTDLLVDRKIAIRKKGKGYIVGIFKIADLEGRISDTDAHQLDSSFKSFIALDETVHLVNRRSLPLAVRSVHTEYLNDDNLGAYLSNLESVFPGQA